jgi:hypothetical protein
MLPGAEQLVLAPPRLGLPFLFVERTRFRHADACAFGELAHGLRERQIVELLNEADHVAARLAAEAVEEASLRVDVEAGGLFLVKGTQPKVRLAPTFEPNPVTDDRNDRYLVPHGLDCLLGDHAAVGFTPIPRQGRGPVGGLGDQRVKARLYLSL